MPTLNENLTLARQLLKILKEKVTGSHDIIPATDLVELLPANKKQDIARFGAKKMDEYNKYMVFLAKVRLLGEKIAQEDKSLCTISPFTIASLASTSLGIGECSEQCTKISYELMTRNRFDFMQVAIIGKVNENDLEKMPYGHTFILLGSDNFSAIRSLGDLKKLTETVVVIDPFINYAGSAHDYMSDNATYINTYKFDRVIQNNLFPKEIYNLLPLIKSQQDKLVEILKSRGYTHQTFATKQSLQSPSPTNKIIVSEQMFFNNKLDSFLRESKDAVSFNKIYDIRNARH